jgi:DNA-binding protein HU-beta
MDGNIMPTKESAAKQSTPPLITLKSVFEQVGTTHDLSKKQVDGFLTDVVSALTAHLQGGARIRMTGLGTLEVRESPERTGRHPGTGEAIQIKASKKVAFRVAKELKEAV